MSKTNLKLDFSLNTDKERKDFADKVIESNSNLSAADLELLANYILFGKDSSTGNSSVDDGLIEIETKYKTYSRKKVDSLDELLENPNFDESLLNSHNKNFYSSLKPTINREKDADIPTIQSLWEAIDYYQELIEVSTGKKENPNLKKLSPVQLYKARHMVVDMRRQQFTLKDMVRPTACMYGPNIRKVRQLPEEIFWEEKGSLFAVAPLGTIQQNYAAAANQRFYKPKEVEEKDYTVNPAPFTIDFRNSNHIYILFEHYEDLRIEGTDRPENTPAAILDTLDFYTDLANLSDAKKFILEAKKKKVDNKTISEEVNRKFGLSHSANYISTIYKQKICGEIAAAVILHYDYYMNRENPFAWKRCNKCGELKLKDTREFMRKTKSSDGLSGRCKECDKKDRELKKIK